RRRPVLIRATRSSISAAVTVRPSCSKTGRAGSAASRSRIACGYGASADARATEGRAAERSKRSSGRWSGDMGGEVESGQAFLDEDGQRLLVDVREVPLVLEVLREVVHRDQLAATEV